MDRISKSLYNHLVASKNWAPAVWITGVILIGIVLRCIAWANTTIIDPDGVLYIHQARAIYFKQWEALTNCGLNYIANYPILIAAIYNILPNWEICARVISLFFGSAVLIPLYLMLRHFLDYKISALTTLIFAVLPLFVGRSIDALRDPTYWFFLVLGLYFFVVHMKQENRLILLLSSVSFLLAAWARIEAVLFLAISFFISYIQTGNLKIYLFFPCPFLY